MKRTHLLLIALCAGTLPSFAQVEPRLAGDWHESSPAGHFSLNISTNGRYTRHHNGQTDSGKITAHDGNWQLHSDSGKVESGRFSMLGGNLKFSGGSMPSALSKGGASHSPTYTPPVVHTQNHASAPTSPQNLQAVFQNNPPVSVDVQPSIQQNVQAQMPVAQPPSLKATIKNKLIQTINSIPTPGASSIPGANRIPNIPNIPNIPYVPSSIQQPLKQAAQQIPSQTYHSMYGNQNSLPGYAPQQDLQSSSSSTATSTAVTTSSQSGPTANQNNNAGYSKRIVTPFDFDKWSAVQQMQPRSASGLQRVPKGGYIPVMKDGKARRYFQGR